MPGYLWEFMKDDDSKFQVVTETDSIDEALEKYRKYKGYDSNIVNINYVSPIEIP